MIALKDIIIFVFFFSSTFFVITKIINTYKIKKELKKNQKERIKNLNIFWNEIKMEYKNREGKEDI